MSMREARIIVVVVGVLLPVVARVAGPTLHGDTFYGTVRTEDELLMILWLQIPSAMVWGAIVALTESYHRAWLAWFPALPAFGSWAFVCSSCDPRSNLWGLALVFGLPFCLLLAAIGWGIGLIPEERRQKISAQRSTAKGSPQIASEEKSEHDSVH